MTRILTVLLVMIIGVAMVIPSNLAFASPDDGSDEGTESGGGGTDEGSESGGGTDEGSESGGGSSDEGTTEEDDQTEPEKQNRLKSYHQLKKNQ